MVWITSLILGLAVLYFIYRLLTKKTPLSTIPKSNLLPELNNQKSITKELFITPLKPYKKDQYIYITNEGELKRYAEVLSKQKVLGVDIENDSMCSYYGKTCLIQMSTDADSFLIDTVLINKQAIITYLKPIFENPKIIKIFHNCRSDLLWIQRDFDGMLCMNIFDTEHMARIVGHQHLGLTKLLKHYSCYEMTDDVKLKFQRSNWVIRPLTKEQLDYAAIDSYFLIFLRSALIADYCKAKKFNETELLEILIEMQKFSTEMIYSKEDYTYGENWLSLLKTKLCAITETTYITEKVFESLWTLRNNEAKAKDISPNSLCDTNLLLTISIQLPESITNMQKLLEDEYGYTISKFISNHSKEIINLIAKWKKEWEENSQKLKNSSRLFNPQTIIQSNTNQKVKKNPTFLAKKPLYENCRMMAPDGEFLCNCDRKKIDWYLTRNLGVLVSTDPVILKLNFDPPGRKERSQKDIDDDLFYTEIKENCCAICGSKEKLMRYHVIPPLYRQHFSEKYKSHRSHDVLQLCFPCHEIATKDINKKKEEFAIQYNAPIVNKKKVLLDKKIMKAKGLAKRLLSMKDNEERIIESMRENLKSTVEILIENKILKSLKSNGDFNEEELKEITELKQLPPDDLSHGESVVSQIEDIGEFIRMWRKRFLTNLEPKFLPKGWNINHRIEDSFVRQSK